MTVTGGMNFGRSAKDIKISPKMLYVAYMKKRKKNKKVQITSVEVLQLAQAMSIDERERERTNDS